MKNQRVARRYAQALMSVSEGLNSLEPVAADMAAVGQMLRESRDFALFVASPIISAAKKTAVFRNVLGPAVRKEVVTFFLLLTRKRREELIPEIIEQFALLLSARLGIVDVSVYSAVSLDDRQRKTLEQRMERYTSLKVRLHESVEKDLVGGLRVQVGDTVLDGSVRRQLELLKGRFVSGGTLS